MVPSDGHVPSRPHARELSEDDSDEERLHEILREEADRKSAEMDRERDSSPDDPSPDDPQPDAAG
ncbi:MAG: hypothetical protein M3483_07890 [Gemmatimonadota bacterium]|nr:hypothetical protein [Gemmatimonadota bacterium]